MELAQELSCPFIHVEGFFRFSIQLKYNSFLLMLKYVGPELPPPHLSFLKRLIIGPIPTSCTASSRRRSSCTSAPSKDWWDPALANINMTMRHRRTVLPRVSNLSYISPNTAAQNACPAASIIPPHPTHSQRMGHQHCSSASERDCTMP